MATLYERFNICAARRPTIRPPQKTNPVNLGLGGGETNAVHTGRAGPPCSHYALPGKQRDGSRGPTLPTTGIGRLNISFCLRTAPLSRPGSPNIGHAANILTPHTRYLFGIPATQTIGEHPGARNGFPVTPKHTKQDGGITERSPINGGVANVILLEPRRLDTYHSAATNRFEQTT